LAVGAGPNGAAGRAFFGRFDWLILLGYVGAVPRIGLRFSRRQRTTEEYFLGNRRMNPLIAPFIGPVAWPS
jgi:Na+/proline symporter